MPNEADTCRRYVVPKLQATGWDDEPHRINEQVTFTDGRIVVTGRQGRRRPGKRADYILRFRPDFPIAVVEAKPTYETPGQGLQQAKDYAEILDLKFAYATNGHGIIEFDYLTGIEREIDTFPTPDELWRRLSEKRTLFARDYRPAAYAYLQPQWQTPPILSGNRHQPHHPGDPARQPPCAADNGHRHGQDFRCIPNLLETLVFSLEPHRRTPKA